MMRDMFWRIWQAKEPVATGRVLGEFIRPDARLRWVSPLVSNYTPSYIATIIRGAMAGDLKPQWDLFDLMEQTWPRLQKNLGELKDNVVTLDWSVQPWAAKGGKPTATAQRKADLVEELIWSMRPRIDVDENDFEDTLRDLLDARGKGISLQEVYWEQREVASGMAWAPRATRYIDPTYYGYPGSGEDRLMLRTTQLTQSSPHSSLLTSQSSQWIELPDHKFLLGICKAKTGHPISGAMLRALGFWWAAANFTGEWLLNYCQLFGQPIRWATYDPTMAPADKRTLQDMLDSMGSSAWAAFPAGTQLELKEAAKGAADNPQIALLELADKICDILVLRQTLTTDVQDSGSRALGDVHADVLSGVTAACASWAAKVLNAQLVRSIVLLNFGDEAECPRIMPSAQTKADPKAEAERLCMLIDRGVPMGREWFYDTVSIPMPGEGDDLLETKSQMQNAAGQMPDAGGQPGQPGQADADEAEEPEDDDADDGKSKVSQINAKAAEVPEDALAPLVRQAVARVVGARERWLAPVQEALDNLVKALQNESLDDQTLVQFAERTARNLPDLFARMDINALADALDDSLGAATVKGLKDALK